MWLLSVVAAGLGLAGGGAALALFALIGFISHLTLLHNVGFTLPTLRHYQPSPLIILTAVIGGLLVSVLAAWSPVIRGHGIPESLEAILVRESRIPLRAALAKPLSAAIAIGTGGPFGAEGPIIVTGGSIGSLVGQVLPVSPAERKVLLATGAAAGMAATFNAPLASVILAVELLLFERSLRTIVPVAIASAVAAGVRMLAFGTTPLFAVHHVLRVGLGHLWLFGIVGLAAGVLAVILNNGLFAIEASFRKLPIKMFWWPAIGAIGFSVIGLFDPRALSVGYSAISDTLNGHFAMAALAALLVTKLFAWWVSLASQTSGGTLAPMFLIGATMGGLLGDAFAHAWPGLHVSPAAFALVAMGATFGAAAQAPFTGMVFAFEVTGQYGMVVPLMIGVAAAELVAELFMEDRIMTEKLSHRGFRVDFNTEVDILRLLVVRQAMAEPVAVDAGTSVADASHFLKEAGTTAVAVVDDDGHYVGLAAVADLEGADPQEPVGPLASQEVRALLPREFLLSALTHLLERGMDSLPVVDGDRVVGQLGRAEIAAQRLRRVRQFEAPQPGRAGALLARLRSRHHPALIIDQELLPAGQEEAAVSEEERQEARARLGKTLDQDLEVREGQDESGNGPAPPAGQRRQPEGDHTGAQGAGSPQERGDPE
jgi:CIC family chloride channel protein